MKNTTLTIIGLIVFVFAAVGCKDNNNYSYNQSKSSGGISSSDLVEQNLLRSMQLVDSAVTRHFSGDGMAMGRFYNPYTETLSEEKGSVWMYTSSIEAVNSILHGLKAYKDAGKPELFDKYFASHAELLAKLYENADYYKGTFTLVSFTQTKEWIIYGVNRASEKGSAEVEGIMNVYDDQQWLIRELLESYKLTGNTAYLEEAEYLTEYVLDGWDATLDENENENGGIPWGPGYVTKHACSNGPMISPLVWLHELYKDKNDQITRRYIDVDQSRKSESMKKSDYYLKYAKATYEWQKKHLLRSDGVYADMMGNCDPSCDVAYETVEGIKYRKHTHLREAVGNAITYNSGTMLSGAADLYRATKDNVYKEDAKKLSDDSFGYFAKLGTTLPDYYTYEITGFRNWFNGVLMRGYLDTHHIKVDVAKNLNSFQQNLDYAYDNFYNQGFLPPNLLVGWNRDKGKNDQEGMFSFAYAAEYALLARYELEKQINK